MVTSTLHGHQKICIAIIHKLYSAKVVWFKMIQTRSSDQNGHLFFAKKRKLWRCHLSTESVKLNQWFFLNHWFFINVRVLPNKSGVVQNEPPQIKWQYLSLDYSSCSEKRAIESVGRFDPLISRHSSANRKRLTICVPAEKSSNRIIESPISSYLPLFIHFRSSFFSLLCDCHSSWFAAIIFFSPNTIFCRLPLAKAKGRDVYFLQDPNRKCKNILPICKQE